MVASLLKKDLLRLRANWIGFAVLLAMPMCITALVGTVFGPAARNNEVPRIKLAIVDEDQNVLGGFLTSTAAGEQSREFLDTVVVDRTQANELIRTNEISAIVVIPKDFTDQFLSGQAAPPLELIKNPTQTFMPAIVEELVRVLAEVLNGVALNLSDELPEIAAVLNQSGTPDMTRLAAVMTRLGDKFELVEDYVFPPVIGYAEKLQESQSENEEPSSFNVFALVMPGLVAMFLLFTAESAAKDLVVERRNKTLMRYRTVRHGLLPLFTAKAIYAFLVTFLAAGIMLIGGGFLFGIQWQNPVQTLVLSMAYSILAVGAAFLMIGAIYRERLISILTTMIIMFVAFFGGSMLPANGLPSPIRNNITPWMPNHLFAESMKRLQFDRPGPDWLLASTSLTAIGLVMIFVAMVLFHRKLLKGAEE